jgi:hypothetical protein
LETNLESTDSKYKELQLKINELDQEQKSIFLQIIISTIKSIISILTRWVERIEKNFGLSE